MDPILIRPRFSGVRYWSELWKFRELLGFLAWRDLLVRYKQTTLGVLWALLRPLVSMLILTLVFRDFGKLPSGPASYPAMVLCGLLPWQLISGAFSESGNSLFNSSHLPGRFQFSPDQFHERCREVQQRWPTGMLTTSTHDTKRSEDVRMRICLLSEIPNAWRGHLADGGRPRCLITRRTNGRHLP